MFEDGIGAGGRRVRKDERPLRESFSGRDVLWERAYGARGKCLADRYDALVEIAKVYSAFAAKEGDELAAHYAYNLRNNWTRLVGFAGASLDELAKDVFDARSVQYYNDRVEWASQLLRKPSVVGWEAQRCLNLCADLCDYLNTSADRKTEKKLRGVYSRLKNVVLPMVRQSHLYGAPGHFNWVYSLESAESAKGQLREIFADKDEETRAACAFMFDKGDPRHPSWYIFIDAKNAPRGLMALVSTRPTGAQRKAKSPFGSVKGVPISVTLPRVRCDSLESQFEGLQPFLDGYVEKLGEFVTGGDFRERTGYKRVVFTGIYRELSRELCKRVGLYDAGPIYAPGVDKWVPLYALDLENPGAEVILPNRLSFEK